MSRKISNDELGRMSVEDFKKSQKTPIIIVLDNVRSLHNVGSVFRTSDAFCIEAIYLCGITGTPPNRDIQKTALGATESVVWKYFNTSEEALLELKKNKYQVFCLEQVEKSIPLNQFTFEKNTKYALVFGHEVDGVSQSIINASDGCIEIPQFGTKHSFNISVTVGIALWHVFISLNSIE